MPVRLLPAFRLPICGVLLFLFLKSPAQNRAQVPGTCAGNPYVISEAIDSFFDISANTCLFVDKTAELALDAVLKKDQPVDFTPLSAYLWEGRFQRGRYAYWLCFSIQNKTRDTLSPAFYSGQKDSMLLYELSDAPPAAIFTGRAVSSFYPWEDLRFPNKYLFSLKLAPGQTHHYLLRLRTIPSFHLDVVPTLYHQAYLSQKNTTDLLAYYLIHGIFMGFLLFAFLFSIAQFIETRGLAFLYFSCYVLAAILIYYRTLQNDEPFFVFNAFLSGFYQHTYYGPLTWLAYIFHLLFVDKFLNAKETSPQLHRFICFAIYSMIGLFLIDRLVFMYDVWLSWQILTWARIAFFLASLYILFLVWKKKDKLYRYVLTGDSLLVFGVIGTILLSYTPTHQVNSPWNYADIPSYFGAFLQILCFILGLAYTSRRTEVQKMRIEEELLIRIKKLTALRRSLQAHSLALATRDVSESTELAEENAFVLKVRAIVESHLDDHHLDVVRLCHEVGMSSSALHRKLTALTGHSANHFIRRIRLSKACILLRDPERTIAAVAYECGFEDPGYFARAFKQEFGLTPKAWRKK